MTKPFRKDGQYFFLTYPHSDLNHESLINFIKSIVDCDWIRVCTEPHKDGTPHNHAVFKTKSRFTTRRHDLFDFQGRHCKIEGVRKLRQAIDYCAKDGCFTDFGELPSGQSKCCWEDILQASKGNEVDWLRCVHEQKISMHVAKRLRQLHEAGNNDLDHYDGSAFSTILQTLPTEFQSMLVVGRPGIGKTTWAKSIVPRPCLLVKHLDQLRHFRSGYHKSIFFDDCDFKHLPRSTQLQICDYQEQTQIHVRYGVACIPAKTPRLFCCNPGNEPFIYDEAIQTRRLTTYIL